MRPLGSLANCSYAFCTCFKNKVTLRYTLFRRQNQAHSGQQYYFEIIKKIIERYLILTKKRSKKQAREN